MTDDREAAIIRRIYTPGYAHAENVLARLRHLEQIMSPDLAVNVIYSEVVES